MNSDRKPHYTDPSPPNSHIIICYRDPAARYSTYSPVGLGINAHMSAKVLRNCGIRVDVCAVSGSDHIASILRSKPTATHVIIEAAFISVENVGVLTRQFGNTEFSCRIHSQVAFLQCEPQAISMIRDYVRLQDHTLNFRLSVNSDRIGTFLEQVYGSSILLLPNLYFIDNPQIRTFREPASLLRVGSFGALRLMKNHATGVSAALMMASVHRRDLEFYLSVGREEGGGNSILAAVRNLFTGVPFGKLREIPWSNWSDFRHIIANLDLHMQLSVSETYNITTADACAQGVPTVCSGALDWTPASWHADIDDVSDIARVGWALLTDPYACARGLAGLTNYNKMSLSKWMDWLSAYHGAVKTMPHLHET